MVWENKESTSHLGIILIIHRNCVFVGGFYGSSPPPWLYLHQTLIAIAGSFSIGALTKQNRSGFFGRENDEKHTSRDLKGSKVVDKNEQLDLFDVKK